MKPVYDQTEVRFLLRSLVAKGYVSVDQLDEPTPGWEANSKTFRLHYPKYQQPEYQNLLRTAEPEPTVELSDPRDFTPTEGATPAQPVGLPLTPEEVDW